MTGAEDWEEGADLLRTIAHAVRMQILSVLDGNERAVGEIEELTGIAQPGLSQQLGVLRKAGLVQTRRDGKQVFYSLVPERLDEARTVLQALGRKSAVPAPADKPEPARRTGGAAVFARITE